MLYFVRHGESQANRDKVFAGTRLYAPLTPRGIKQAEAAGRDILNQHIQIHTIISSPIERALDTARIIAGIIGFDTKRIQIDDRLKEYDMGSLTGRSFVGVTSDVITAAVGAEDPNHFQDRAVKAIDAARALPGDTLIVSHGGIARMLVATKRGLNPKNFHDVAGIPNSQIIKLDSLVKDN